MRKNTKRQRKEYHAWRGMKRRCNNSTNPRDRWHREKGIQVCEQWRDNFRQFLADIGKAPTPKHTIERIDNNGNYEPSNCRWATPKEQANNRSGIRIRKFTFNGMTMNMTEWNNYMGFSHGVINRRIRILGWSIEDAFTKPKGYHPRGHEYRTVNLGKHTQKKHNNLTNL